nr:MAG TPA: hypothetical protein [Caudoviricetes sp.]
MAFSTSVECLVEHRAQHKQSQNIKNLFYLEAI